ncbi:MAG: heavy-metal-associated domain-containing protein [Planctomycetota bacterium]
MKTAGYLLAAIGAVGIAIALATLPGDGAQDQEQVASAAPVEVTPAALTDEAGEMLVSVPGMHCEHACFPRVKESLEGNDSVSEVVLAPQPNENALTNKQVIVKYEAGFDLTGALARLHEIGYDQSEVVQ